MEKATWCWFCDIVAFSVVAVDVQVEVKVAQTKEQMQCRGRVVTGRHFREYLDLITLCFYPLSPSLSLSLPLSLSPLSAAPSPIIGKREGAPITLFMSCDSVNTWDACGGTLSGHIDTISQAT